MTLAPKQPPSAPASNPDPAQAEVIISRILQWGVIASLLLVTLGTAVSFMREPSYHRSHEALLALTSAQDPVPFPHSFAAVWSQAWHGRGQGLVMAGVLLLIATPIVRVAAAVLIYHRQRDRAFVLITSTVLALLLLSFLLGKVG